MKQIKPTSHLPVNPAGGLPVSTFTILITTSAGVEDLTAKEAEEVTGRRAGIDGPGRVYFEAKNVEDALKALYSLRLAKRVMIKLAEAEVTGKQDDLTRIYRTVKRAELSSFLAREQTFAIRSKRIGEHEYTSIDVARVAGQAVIDHVLEARKYRQKVNLDSPDVIFRSYVIHTKFYFTLDLTGDVSLERRGYKTEVAIHPASLKPVLAASMLKLSGWDGTQSMLDPMCGLGTICIEAAWMAKKIPAAYLRKDDLQVVRYRFPGRVDLAEVFREVESQIEWGRKPRITGSDVKEKYIAGAKKHAENALVQDDVSFMVKNIEEYLRGNVEASSFDLIVTNPPYGIRVGRAKRIASLYTLLVKASRKLLTGGGTLCLITPHATIAKRAAESEGFHVTHERWVKYGNLNVRILVFKNNG